ncbi:MAG: serine/threonine-protein phosphatase [bacterium]|nr:serine/threonine-protein phosphatase [Acidimicrobiia bacterium]MCY4649307.1 serine/threonine-protein phosphatase [bacterium]
MNCTWATASHIGFGPQINQDRMFPLGSGSSEEPVVVMVADGLGGEKFGQVAADLAVQTAQAADGSPADRARAANRAILDLVRREPQWSGTYTTLTLMEFGDGMARIAHIGDTRAYLFRDNRITVMTNDHTAAWQRIRQGVDPKVAHSMPKAASLVRVLGFDEWLEVEKTDLVSQDGDRWLVCSDGLYRMLSDRQLKRFLGSGDPEECVWNLVESALGRGASDNVTAVVIDIDL